MLQPSKLLKSRNEWREKAIKRADEQREQRKVSKRHRETIAELKVKIEELKQELKEVGAKKRVLGISDSSCGHRPESGTRYTIHLCLVDRAIRRIVSQHSTYSWLAEP
jgi:hypothetical protein